MTTRHVTERKRKSPLVSDVFPSPQGAHVYARCQAILDERQGQVIENSVFWCLSSILYQQEVTLSMIA